MTVRRQTDNRTGREFWLVDVDFELPDGRRKRVRKVSPVQTRRGAEEYERQVRAAFLSGALTKKVVEVPTLATFEKAFMERYAAVHNRPMEQRTKRLTLKNHLLPAFGHLRLDQISTMEIDGYKAAKLKAGLAAKSINIHLAILKKILAVAVEWEQLERAPTFKPMKVPKPEFDFLDFDEAERLLEKADDEWWPMIAVALDTGLRQGELLGLRWGDVDLVRRRVVVRRSHVRGHTGPPKNGKFREIGLTDRALRALKVQSPRTKLRGELVFCGKDGGFLPFHLTNPPLERACRRAGLRLIGWHVLRHTFASHLVMLGTPQKAVQELLGHSSSAVTDRYAHLSPDVRHQAIERLNRRDPNGKMTARRDLAVANDSDSLADSSIPEWATAKEPPSGDPE